MQPCKIHYRGLLYHWGVSFPDEALRNQHEVFPVISNELGTELEIIFPKSEKDNRYPYYFKNITGFYAKYLDNNNFRAVIPLSITGFIVKNKEEFKRIATDASLLEYGNGGTGTDPYADIKQYGPYKTIEQPHNVKLFFVYQQSDGAFVQALKDCLDKGLNGTKSLNEFVKFPYSYKDEWNIPFDNLQTAVATCYHALENRQKEHNVRYLVIYLSPIEKDKATNQENKIYIRLQELFLFYGYHSQVIFRDKITKSNFNMALPNIKIAMLLIISSVCLFTLHWGFFYALLYLCKYHNPVNLNQNYTTKPIKTSLLL